MLMILLGILGAILVFVWFLYNSLVTGKARVEESWSQIDVQLKRRANLIPNLVETVKGYMSHEQKIFEDLRQARQAMQQASGAREAGQADQQLQGVLNRLFALAEDNPELKASENFKELQEELSDTEDKVAYARQFYNTNVMEYNVKLRTFPNVLIASLLGFKAAEFFAANEQDREAPKVKF